MLVRRRVGVLAVATCAAYAPAHRWRSSSRSSSRTSSSSSTTTTTTTTTSTTTTRPRTARRPPLPPAIVQLYANKQAASANYEDDLSARRQQLMQHFAYLARSRVMRYYALTTLVLLVGGSAYLWQMQQDRRGAHGLLGPKRRVYRSRLTVVLDVDETIVSFGDKAFRTGAGVVPRPYLAELLDYLSAIDAEVILWSACSDRYMREVLRVIDPLGQRVSHYIVRDTLWFAGERMYEKNIAWLCRPLADTLIVENRALSVRNCNANALLVDDFVRGEYMDTGRDWPENDAALHHVTQIVADLERSGKAVPAYLGDAAQRHAAIRTIPCHLAIHQLPDEIARGVFYFIGDKYQPAHAAQVVQLSMDQRGVM